MRTPPGPVTPDARPEAATGTPSTGLPPSAVPAPSPAATSEATVPAPGPAPVPPPGFVTATAPDTWCADATVAANAPEDADRPRDTREAARRPGRPRSERAEQAILAAAIEAVGENGIDGMSCEDVAARAGVGKATLYRRWQGKEDLLIAAFAAMRRPMPEPGGESVRDDLVALLTVVAEDADDPRYAQQYALLHGAGVRYPRLVARYKERVVEPRRELVRSVLRRGVEAGQLRPDTDVEVAMLLLTGAVMARGKHDLTPAAPGFVDSAVDELLRGIAADGAALRSS